MNKPQSMTTYLVTFAIDMDEGSGDGEVLGPEQAAIEALRWFRRDEAHACTVEDRTTGQTWTVEVETTYDAESEAHE